MSARELVSSTSAYLRRHGVPQARLDAELLLAVPDPRPDRRRPTQRARLRCLAEPQAPLLRQVDPLADELLDPHRDLEEIGEDALQALSVTGLAREGSCVVQLGQVRHRVALA